MSPRGRTTRRHSMVDVHVSLIFLVLLSSFIDLLQMVSAANITRWIAVASGVFDMLLVPALWLAAGVSCLSELQFILISIELYNFSTSLFDLVVRFACQRPLFDQKQVASFVRGLIFIILARFASSVVFGKQTVFSISTLAFEVPAAFFIPSAHFYCGASFVRCQIC